MSSSLATPEKYVRSLLDNEGLEILSAIGLLIKVGFKDEAKSEIESLCQILGLGRPEDFIRKAKDMSQLPGFMAGAGRYFYVTPDIIAQVAFTIGWKRWVECDPPGFLKKIHESILQSFLKRVAKSGSKEVCRIVSDFFRKWANSLTAAELGCVQKTKQFVTVVESSPDDYLPILKRLVEESTESDLRSIADASGGEWGPRRHVVWLLERLAWYPEYFQNVEAILLRLALAETEPGISNNATEIWKRQFRIFLSGTAVPFSERIELLKDRIFCGDPKVANLALDALGTTLDTRVFRIDVRAVVADRITPEEWRPRNDQEFSECFRMVLKLLTSMKESSDALIQKAALRTLTQNMVAILNRGFLDELKLILRGCVLQEAALGGVIHEIDRFLQLGGLEGSRISEPYAQSVQQWLNEIIGTSVHRRLVRAVGGNPWDRSILGDKDLWDKEIASLAEQFLKDENILESEMPWLLSGEARSNELFGIELGKRDQNASCLNMLVKQASATGSTGFCAGYVNGLLSSNPYHTDRVNQMIDAIQDDYPEVAYHLFMAGGSSTHDVKRLLMLIDKKTLPAEFLRGALYFAAQGTMSIETLKDLLKRCLIAFGEGSTVALGIAVELVAYCLLKSGQVEKKEMFKSVELVKLIRDLLDLTVTDAAGEHRWWFSILKDFATYVDPHQAIELAGDALVSSIMTVRDEAEKFLIGMAGSFPEQIMELLGGKMVARDIQLMFALETLRELFASIPIDIVKQWLQKNGVVGARCLARHLSMPFADENGNYLVPPLTEYVFETFDYDDQTFNAFLAGIHSFQLYSGDIAAAMEKEADLARQFLNHRLKRIREWSSYEIERAQTDAEKWRERDEESTLE